MLWKGGTQNEGEMKRKHKRGRNFSNSAWYSPFAVKKISMMKGRVDRWRLKSHAIMSKLTMLPWKTGTPTSFHLVVSRKWVSKAFKNSVGVHTMRSNEWNMKLLGLSRVGAWWTYHSLFSFLAPARKIRSKHGMKLDFACIMFI